MESRFDTQNDEFEIIGDDDLSKDLKLSIAYFRWLYKENRRSQASNKPDYINKTDHG